MSDLETLSRLWEGWGQVLTAIETARIVTAVRAKLHEVSPTGKLLAAYKPYLERFDAARDEQTPRRIAGLEAKAADQQEFRTAVLEMVNDLQFWRLHLNLEWEAARSTLADRQQMLGHAAAGLADPAMPISEKARIERTLRSLDPEDIVALRAIALNPSRAREDFEHKRPTSFHALMSSGCVAVPTHVFSDHTPRATPLGLQLLDVLDGYSPEEAP